MIGYYDIVLGLIATLLVAGAIATAIIGVAGVLVTSVLAMALVGHAMFIRPPTGLEKEVQTPATSYEAAD